MAFLKINKFIYWFSISTWVANICFVILPFFLDFSAFWILPILISNLFQFIVFTINTNCQDDEIKPHYILDLVLSITKYISIVVTAVSFASFLIVQGRPRIVDGIYCIVDRGIVRTVSSGWFFYFFLCESFEVIFGLLIFSSWITQEIRILYLQRNKYK